MRYSVLFPVVLLLFACTRNENKTALSDLFQKPVNEKYLGILTISAGSDLREYFPVIENVKMSEQAFSCNSGDASFVYRKINDLYKLEILKYKQGHDIQSGLLRDLHSREDIINRFGKPGNSSSDILNYTISGRPLSVISFIIKDDVFEEIIFSFI